MNFTRITAAVFGMLALSGGAVWAAETNYVADLDLRVSQGWGDPHRDLSVDGNPLVIGGHKYEHGLGTHAISIMRIGLDGKAESFTADVGVDGSESADGTVTFTVIGDGKKLFESGIMHGGDVPKPVSVDLHGVKTLMLFVGDAGDGIDHDHADWADAKIVMTEGKPVVLDPEGEDTSALASKSGASTNSVPPPPIVVKEEPVPAIHGAKVFGVRPGSPFLFTIAATGDRPMTFSVGGLPSGLKVDPQTGQITGVLKKSGEHVVTLRAKNAAGAAERKLKIICGPLISLTPALGWNSWNCFGSSVTADKVRAAADAMVASGLVHHGWTYINIDDYWEQNPRRMARDASLGGPGRDAEGNIVPNPRFPDMKGLVDYIHSLGLKAGIYSSPGPLTCGGCVASWQHEDQDARQYAAWGFDYLKYDWCSYGEVALRDTNTDNGTDGTRRRPAFALDTFKKPYFDMRAALDKAHRDIVFSLCQYGMGDVWTWGAEVGGNSWRTSDDITDNWRSLSGNGFRLGGHEKYVNPGHFDDPDMMVLGWVDVGSGRNLHPTRLTHDEQYTHMSLWCLLSSPLLLGCDLTKLDDFTLSLLTNDEVLDVNQDPLARQASLIVRDGPAQVEVWAKSMEDGSKAVGLFNRSPAETTLTAKWSDLGITGSQTVRDLWRHQDAGKFDGSFTATVPSHGVVLVKISPAN
ncbi:MAG TPA: NPCBM/NEW2 domain-containing protein [Verrucomicrobiae bacterium]|jgi:alpha-galactosidase|nr:NPCBM/NEW2 domain-containing protein [Verrucomicrobiae bacterium]